MATIRYRFTRAHVARGLRLNRRGTRALVGVLVVLLAFAGSALAVTSPTVTVTDVTVAEGNGKDINVTFVVSLSEAGSETVTVRYRTADGSAVAPADYEPASGMLTFTPGELSKTVVIEADGDTVPEGDEVFYLELFGPVNAVIADPQGAAIITDDDRTVAIEDAFVAEPEPGGVAVASFQVVLSAPSSRRVAVDFSTLDGSAVAGEDYVPRSGTIVFEPGEATKTVLVEVRNDEATGSDEFFFAALSAPFNANLVRAKGQATIVQNDRVVSIGDTFVLEPDPGTEETVVFEVSLSVPTSGTSGTVSGSPSSKPISVDFRTADGTAIAGQHYVPASGTLAFKPGEGTRTFPVVVRNDAVAGEDKSFFVYLSNPTNAELADAVGVATIVDAARTLTIEDTTLTEGNSAGVVARFVLSLSAPAPYPVTVRYATRDGSGTAGTDYQPASGILTFHTGEATKAIEVPVVGDLADEGESPEFFYLDLSNPAGAQLVRPTAAGFIADDDRSLSVVDVTVVEGDAGTSDAIFTVSLSSYVGRAVQVDFATADGSANAPADYATKTGTLIIPPGELAGTVTVPVVGDVIDEPPETFLLRLSNPVNASLRVASAVATISVSDRGYWLVASDGGVFSFGDAPFYGSAGDMELEQPIVNITTSPSGNGYWLVGADGSVFAYGDAGAFGSVTDADLTEPVVGMAAMPDGTGYWIATADGRVLPFGAAEAFGSMEGVRLRRPVVAMAATSSGKGYWLASSDGGVFSFGDAGFFGSTGGIRLNQPIVAMTPTPSGNGYWLTASDGGVFSFGDAGFFGSTGGIRLNRPIVAMTPTPSGNGYWLTASDGGVFSFGDADFLGSTGGTTLNRPVVGMARRTGRLQHPVASNE